MICLKKKIIIKKMTEDVISLDARRWGGRRKKQNPFIVIMEEK